jgi:drug/metabolite transporter (DMT)-like permease
MNISQLLKPWAYLIFYVVFIGAFGYALWQIYLKMKEKGLFDKKKKD